MISLISANWTNCFAAQKAFVGYSLVDSSFKCASIPIAKELRAVCQLVPSLEIQDEFCYASISVIQYLSLHNLAPILSSRPLDRQFRNAELKVFDNVIEAKSIDVSVVLCRSSNVQKWKSIGDLGEIIYDILHLFIVVNCTLVRVPLCCKDNKNDIAFICVNATGSRKSACRITRSTIINVEEILSVDKFERRCTNEPIRVVGLSKQLKILNSIYNANVKFKKFGSRTTVSCVQKILIIGPPGCGKTTLVNSFAKNKKCGLIVIEGSQLSHITPGESESILRSFFEEAVSRSKEKNEDICIVHLDQVENICRKSKFVASHLKRLSSQLFRILGTIHEMPGIIVIATTNDVHSLDSFLRRSSRIQMEIYIGMPNEKERQEILQLHGSNLKAAICKKIAACTVGYTGADLAFLVQNVNRQMDQDWKHTQNEADILELFNQYLRKHTPSAMRGGLGIVRLRDVQMNQLGGMEEVKSILERYIEWPLKHSAEFKKLGIPIPKGLLLFGPPGCAKTSVVCAVANAVNTTFLAVSAAELYSPYVGEAERNVLDLFQKARMNSPCILFIDEIDALVGNRNTSSKNVQTKILSAFLTEMDGFENKFDWSLQNGVIDREDERFKNMDENNNIVVVIAATNRPDKLDSAFLRPGRLDKLIYVKPPDKKERIEILRAITRHSKIPLAKCVDFDEIAEKTENFTGADLKNLMNEAGYMALFRNSEKAMCITRDHILDSLLVIPVVVNDLDKSENFSTVR